MGPGNQLYSSSLQYQQDGAPMTKRATVKQATIARALLSERESATKAERERCAERFEIAATELGRQECCGFAAPDHECCADPLYMISDRDGARAIRNGADFVPAAAIRKGDGE